MNKDFVIKKGCCKRCGLKFKVSDDMSAPVEGKDYCKQCEKELGLGHIEIGESREIIAGLSSYQSLPYGEVSLRHRGSRYGGI
jgi:hypothetical protein